MTGSSVGIDVGGTFTDFVVRAPSGRLSSGKVPTTPANPALGVMHGLTTLVGSAPLASVAHGTTIVTNAIVEGRGAVVGLITTRGFRDVLEIARVSRLHLYDLKAAPKPPAPVPRRLRLEVSERVGPDGAIETALALDEIPELVATLAREGVQSVAVCLLHSYANPEHERALRAHLERHFAHVCVSSDINAEFREYERSCTTVLNAAVMPLASSYIDQLAERLGLAAAGATLHLLHSAGGMMSVETARARPLALASSGPAAGVAAAAHVATTLGIQRALAFDMGGTTTDVCLIADGVAEPSSQRKLGGYPVRLPMAAVESIGAGGGSIAHVDAAGALRVGPRSAGAAPGLRAARLRPARLHADRLRRRRPHSRRGAGRRGRDRARPGAGALGRLLGPRLPGLAAALRRRANLSRAAVGVGRQAGGPAAARAAGAVRGAADRRGHRARPHRRAVERRPALQRPELRDRDPVAQHAGGAARRVRGAPPPTLRLRHRRERGVPQSEGRRAGPRRRGDTVGARAGGDGGGDRRAARSLRRRGRGRAAALRPRRAGAGTRGSRARAGRGRVVHHARLSRPALRRRPARQSRDRGRRVSPAVHPEIAEPVGGAA